MLTNVDIDKTVLSEWVTTTVKFVGLVLVLLSAWEGYISGWE